MTRHLRGADSIVWLKLPRYYWKIAKMMFYQSPFSATDDFSTFEEMVLMELNWFAEKEINRLGIKGVA